MKKDAKTSDLDTWIFKQITDKNPTPILITDRNGIIKYINNEFSEVTGYSLEEAIGKKPNILKSGEHDDEFYKDLWETIKSGQTWTGEICNKKKNGQVYWEQEIISPLSSPDENNGYFISIRVDDTEKRRADLLEQVKQLAGGIAHEINQPLQVLTIMASLLELYPGKFDYIEKMQQSVKRITTLVASLKNITTLKKRGYLSETILDLRASSASGEKSVLRTIMVIDDENELQEILIEGLKLEGYECVGVNDADIALNLVKDHNFDLIICDINMPGINGLKLFEKLKGKGYKGHFLFMTGYAIQDFMKDTIFKADGVIQKPFHLAELKLFLTRIFKA